MFVILKRFFMNPIGQLITFIASVSIILYFLMIGYYLHRIMNAVEKMSGVNKATVVECNNCGKQMNLGIGFKEPFTTCPICKSRIILDQPELFLTPSQQKEEVLP